jgi:long-chain acyl-CoA synthetase
VDFIRGQIAEQTADLASYEQVRRIALLPRELTIEDGELSPTLKVKRRVVEERYKALIDAAYAEKLERGAPATPGAGRPAAAAKDRPGAPSGLQL